MNFENETLLLVEDNEDDVFIFQRAFRHAKVTNPLQVVRDGEEAMDYLFGREQFADREKHPLPKLVFLDLKLPLRGGLEVLQALREDVGLADLSVVILTSSAEERDVARARELAAQAYLVKPPVPAILVEAISAVRARLAGALSNAVPKITGDLLREGAAVSREGRTR